jgi:phospholipase C
MTRPYSHAHHGGSRLFATLVVMALLLQHLPVMASAAQIQADAALDIETTTPIKHFVTVMQSNHTFDSIFGMYPGADGIPPDTCLPVDVEDPDNTECIRPFPLENNGYDLDHTHQTFELQYHDGQNDGFISAHRARGEDGTTAVGYYTENDLPFSYNAADEYVLFDRFFTSAAGGSRPNRMYWVSGGPGIPSYLDDHIPAQGWVGIDTVFDMLEERGIPWKFYIENYDPAKTYRNRGSNNTFAQVSWVPVLSFDRYIDDPKYKDNIVDLEQYFTDLENNTLPSVSYVVTVGSTGHPPSDMMSSERILRRMVNQLMMSPAWETSAIQWAYDDWGGWYDHVPPPQIDEFGYGFRTACQLVSPYAREGYIDGTTLDFTSILRFIEDNWSLPSMDTRDRDANSIAVGFDFSQTPRQAKLIPMTRDVQTLAIPKRSAVYLSYTVAIASVTIIIGSAFGLGRNREEVDA